MHKAYSGSLQRIENYCETLASDNSNFDVTGYPHLVFFAKDMVLGSLCIFILHSTGFRVKLFRKRVLQMYLISKEMV